MEDWNPYKKQMSLVWLVGLNPIGISLKDYFALHFIITLHPLKPFENNTVLYFYCESDTIKQAKNPIKFKWAWHCNPVFSYSCIFRILQIKETGGTDECLVCDQIGHHMFLKVAKETNRHWYQTNEPLFRMDDYITEKLQHLLFRKKRDPYFKFLSKLLYKNN